MSYKFNPFTNTMDRVVNTGLYFIDTIFSNNMTIPENKVLVLKDPIASGDIIINGELYLL